MSAKKLSIRKKEFRGRETRGLQLDRLGSREAAWAGGGEKPWEGDQGASDKAVHDLNSPL